MQIVRERRMSYCKVGPDSDVYAYFHRLGHTVCETCDWTGQTKSALIIHLEEHRERGDKVPDATFARLRREQESNWI